MFGLLQDVKMIIQNKIRSIHSLSVLGCQDGGVELVVIEILALPYVCANHKGTFRDLRMRNLLWFSLDVLKMMMTIRLTQLSSFSG
jgi:hypothetical protein